MSTFFLNGIFPIVVAISDEFVEATIQTLYMTFSDSTDCRDFRNHLGIVLVVTRPEEVFWKAADYLNFWIKNHQHRTFHSF